MRQAFLLVAVLLVTACSKQPVNTAPSGGGAPGNAVGATTSRAAVERFMMAVKAQDLQAMSTLWGNSRGPARDRFKREDLEKRLVVMQCLLNHDRWSFTDDQPRLSSGGRNMWPVSLTRRSATAKTTLTTVTGPGGRWFLEDADLAPLREFCA